MRAANELALRRQHAIDGGQGPANRIGAHRSIVVARVNPDGPSIDP